MNFNCNKKAISLRFRSVKHNRNVKIWLCEACQFPKCQLCHLSSDEPVQFGPAAREAMKKTRNYERKWICDWCLYPPCGGCGLQRTRATKRKGVQFELWFCQECWSKKTEKMQQEHPPCSSCGVKKEFLEQRAQPCWEDSDEELSFSKDKHAHRSWRCSACWRKTSSKCSNITI